MKRHTPRPLIAAGVAAAAAMILPAVGATASASQTGNVATVSGPGYTCTEDRSGEVTCEITGDSAARIDINAMVEHLDVFGVDADTPMRVTAVGGAGGGANPHTQGGDGGVAVTETTLATMNTALDNHDGVYSVFLGSGDVTGHAVGAGGSSTILFTDVYNGDIVIDDVAVVAGGGGGAGNYVGTESHPWQRSFRSDGSSGGIVGPNTADYCPQTDSHLCAAGDDTAQGPHGQSVSPGGDPFAAARDQVGGNGGAALGTGGPVYFANTDHDLRHGAGTNGSDQGASCRMCGLGGCFSTGWAGVRGGGGGGGFGNGHGGETDLRCNMQRDRSAPGGSGGGSAALTSTHSLDAGMPDTPGSQGSLTIQFELDH